MRIETTDHFIIVQLEEDDFRWVKCDYGNKWGGVVNKQPYQVALKVLKQQIPEADRFFDGHHKVWMITNTPEYLEIAQQIKQQLESDLGGGVRTPEEERK